MERRRRERTADDSFQRAINEAYEDLGGRNTNRDLPREEDLVVERRIRNSRERRKLHDEFSSRNVSERNRNRREYFGDDEFISERNKRIPRLTRSVPREDEFISERRGRRSADESLREAVRRDKFGSSDKNRNERVERMVKESDELNKIRALGGITKPLTE